MARSISTIKNEIIAQKNAEASLSGLTSNSQTAIWNLWAFITAVAINIHEQFLDLIIEQVEEIAANAVPGTALWLKDRSLNFQFGDVVSVNPDFSVGYAIDDPTKKIVTQASIKQSANRLVIIKIAKGTTPSFAPLTVPELNAFKSYIDKIKFAGTQTNSVSETSDKLKVAVDIYYDGQYVETTVKTNVIAAIDEYLASLPFDGVVALTALMDAIQAVQGVIDVVFNDVIARPDSVPLASTSGLTYMVTGSDWLARNYETSAGYIVGETTGGNTLNDTINMILQ